MRAKACEMRVLRAISALAALASAIAVGFSINSLTHVGPVKVCLSDVYATDNCPSAVTVYRQIDPRVPHDTLIYYIATLVLLIVVIGLVALLRNVLGTALAAGLAFVAGLVFLFGQFWYFDIEPGFSAPSTWIADLLGITLLVLVLVLLAVEATQQTAKSGRRRAISPQPPFSPGSSTA